jgi:hypothetical protein
MGPSTMGLIDYEVTVYGYTKPRRCIVKVIEIRIRLACAWRIDTQAATGTGIALGSESATGIYST